MNRELRIAFPGTCRPLFYVVDLKISEEPFRP